MRSILLSTDIDSKIGMRLAGISGQIVSSKEEVLKIIDQLISNREIGIIIITKEVKQMAYDEIMERKLSESKTLIVEIPTINQTLEEDYITKYIRESIGIKF